MRSDWFILLLVLFFFISCDHDATHDSRKAFRYNESQGISTLDPAYTKSLGLLRATAQLYNGLLQLNDSLRVIPCIAKRWRISDNGKRYTFILRQDVFFHDHPFFPNGKGRRVVASDFSYSFNRIIDPRVASPGSWIFNSLNKSAEGFQNGFRAVNDTVFEIALKNSFPPFQGILTMPYCYVVPHEIVERYGNDFGHHPVGTGPFRCKLWIDGEKLIFVRNEKYFEKDTNGLSIPYLDAVAITFINDLQSEFLQFLKGNLDFLSGVSSTSKDELITRMGELNPKYESSIKMYTRPYLNTVYLGFFAEPAIAITGNSPVYNERVRKAINYGMDRKKIIKFLRNNIGMPANSGFVPKGLPSYSEMKVKGYDYDPDKARQLLAEAGYPMGKGLQPISLVTTVLGVEICEYIQQELSQIGIKINIEVNTGASFFDLISNSKAAFFYNGWIADYADAENYLSLFYSKNFSPGGPNDFHFKDTTFDRLYIKAMNTEIDSVRYKYYQLMDHIIIDKAAVVPLFYDEVVCFTHRNIENFQVNSQNQFNLKYVIKH